jgi:hypothetical protein
MRLTDDGLAFDAVAGVVVGAGHGRQLAVGRRDVSEFVAKPAFVQRACAAAYCTLRRVVHRIVCAEHALLSHQDPSDVLSLVV